MSVQTQQIHRRKSSKDKDEMHDINVSVANANAHNHDHNTVSLSPPSSVEVTVPEQRDLPSVTLAPPPPPPRSRTHSTPLHAVGGHGHNRTPSVPSVNLNSSGLPPSAGPYRTSFQPIPSPASRQINGHGHAITSPFRSSFGGSSMGPPPQMNGHSHSRTRSISTPFSPVSPSPLSSSFPPMSTPTFSISPPNSGGHFSPSQSAPETLHSKGQAQAQSSLDTGAVTTNSTPSATTSTAATHTRRHSRMHSRNLSVFFPRPESLSHRTISEDGDPDVEEGQELTIPAQEAPLIPSAGSSVSIPGSRRHASQPNPPITPLGQGFTFGGRPPPQSQHQQHSSASEMSAPRMAMSSSEPGSTSAGLTGGNVNRKRGHHHKHSLSHNFFSFLEPGSGAPMGRGEEEELHTQPTPTPISPWAPDSAAPSKTSFNAPLRPPSSASSTTSSSFPTTTATSANGHGNLHQQHPEPRISLGALSTSISQFTLGAWLWVTGQQVGSLACTGLGYWVVFDSFGVALAGVVPGWLASSSRGRGKEERERERIRRPYGNGRLETVLMFAQAVYLLFSSVYVCKETVEHVLLSAGGGGEGHHHHPGDEEEGVGIAFPIFITFVTFISLLGTALVFENNTKILHITGNRIPSIPSLLRSVWSPSRQHRNNLNEPPPTSKLGLLLSNPFIASPLFFCVGIVGIALFLPPAQHRSADLVLASIIALVTFQVAYRACVVLGAVLLQTSPPRGLANGKMEAFLRAMREVERHPHVLHLPAPHIWQLTPSYASPPPPSSKDTSSISTASSSLVITLELHVREDLGDEDVLKLTRWAWERCVNAVIGGSGGGAVNLKDVKEMGEDGPGVPEVTVGVVRG